MLTFVRETVFLTQPAAIHFCDGSQDEADRLADVLVEAGTIQRLDPTLRPNSFLARTDPTDVARVEGQTFICSLDEADAGPTNNWMHPDEMKPILLDRFRGSMRGRTMYVMPYCMGPIDAPTSKFGVEISDSAYVVLSMRVMTRMGAQVQAKLEAEQLDFVECLHSVGAPLATGQTDVPWPCCDTKYIVQFPEERKIWSYGSGYGGNSLLGKKCFSLRIASAMGRDEGWLAEHMLIVKVTSPSGRSHHVAAAFPSACGKTNFAMLEPTLEGWTIETLGDDIAWLTWDAEGRLRAVNPEFGFFGVAPGTGRSTNPVAMQMLDDGNTVFTNVALTDEGDVWWEGMGDKPDHLTDWLGQDWTPEAGTKAAHPNSRFCTPIAQCPTLSSEYDELAGVPIDLIIFGGRRASTVPLVSQARDWAHGVFLGATLSSETTAAAAGAVGVLRRDPMAMLPFLGYHVGDYFAHWLAQESPEHQMPAVFHVNWFRKHDGSFVWPGFGDNARALKWMIERLEGTAEAVETPIGFVPAPGALDVAGLDLAPEQLEQALAVDADEWRAELPMIQQWLASLGDKVPGALHAQLDDLERRLG